MNEAVQSEVPDQGPSFAHGGILLKQHRVARGVHLAGLSAVLKVPVARLQALEDGRFEDLPDLIFARALAGSVCRALKIDPAPILAALPLPPVSGQPQPPLESLDVPAPSGLSPSAPAFEERVKDGRRPSTAKRTSLGVILVLLLLGLVLWWQQQGQAMRTSDALEPSVAPAAVVPALPPAIAPDIPITSATSTSQEAPAATQAAELAPAPAPVTQPIPPAEPAAVQPPVLRLSASNSTWVQVQGATRLRFERTLQAGEAVEFTEDLPLRVVLGRAEAVEVQVHGQPFDIQPHTRSSVARFEVR